MSENPISLEAQVQKEKDESWPTPGSLPSPFLSDEFGIRHSPSIVKLTEALAYASRKFGEIVKDTDNPYYRSTYADLSQLIKQTKPALLEQGLVILQSPEVLLNVVNRELMEWMIRLKREGVIDLTIQDLFSLGVVRSIVRLTTVLNHKSGEWLSFVLDMPITLRRDKEGRVVPLDAQAVGSAITYGRRYSYAPIFNISAEEDDDANAASGSRRQHLEGLQERMGMQERISQPMVNAFMDACKKAGKTADQISAYLVELNNYNQAEELTKGEFNDAIRWALSKTTAPAKDEDLTPQLEESVKQAKRNRFDGLHAAAAKRKISHEDLHQAAGEMFKVDSLTKLSGEQVNKLIKWVEQQ